MGAAETFAGVPPIHLHVKKLVEWSHVHIRALQASHAFCRLVDRDHKFSVETLKGRIQGDLKSPVTEAWLNLDLSSLDLDPVNRFNQPGLCPKDLYHGRCTLQSPTCPCGLRADATNPCGVHTESAWSPHGLLGPC
jgi:hypothetical protein